MKSKETAEAIFELIKPLLQRNKEHCEKFGFTKCPKCGASHTNKTMTCRKCEYKVSMGEVS